MPNKVSIVYARKSKATKKGESVENQVKWGIDYIRRMDPETADEDIVVFKDDGFSGKSIKRPGFTEALALIKQKKVKRIVVYRLDRISRSVCDFADFMKLLEKTDTEFVSVQESFDTSSPMGRAMMQVTAVFAQLERETISERVMDNMLELSLKGIWLGGTPPRGFTSKRILATKAGEKDHSILVLNEEEMKSVKRCFEVYYDLRNLLKSVRQLVEEGVEFGEEQKPSDSKLRNLLTNPVYCVADERAYDYFYEMGCTMGCEKKDFDGTTGVAPFNRHKSREGSLSLRPATEWIIAKGAHPGIVSSEKWIAINDSLIENAIAHPRRQKAVNNYALLTGLLVCARCGRKMYSQPQNSGRGKRGKSAGFTYICETRKAYGAQACDCPSISGLVLDEAIRQELLKYCEPTSATGKQLEYLQKKVDKNYRRVNAYADLSAQLKAKENKLKSLVEKWIEVDSDSEIGKAMRGQMDQLETDIKILRVEILKHEGEKGDDTKEGNTEMILSVLQHFDKYYREMSVPKQRDFLLTIIEKVVWDGEKADIFLRGRGS